MENKKEMSVLLFSAGGINFVSAEPGLVRDYRLAFNLGGVPPIEPTMAGIEPEEGAVIHGTLIKLPRSVVLTGRKICHDFLVVSYY